MDNELIQWLLKSEEPWTIYRTLVDLLDLPEADIKVQAARAAMLVHPQVQALLAATTTWGERPFKRHNDAAYPIYAFSTLADFGVRATDTAIAPGIESLMAHQAEEGAFQSLVNIPKSFGGTGDDRWTWMLCDAPTLLYALLAFGLDADPRVQRAVDHLLASIDENGWRCVVDPALGKFKGPGRRSDPCPVVNVFALKALAQVPSLRESDAVRTGTEMLLWHWEHQKERKLFMFGIGSDFRKLKYPFVWYNILHVVEVLSYIPEVYADARFEEMVAEVLLLADAEGRFTAQSMYRAWKEWSFANKRQPSPWLTFLVLRILKRLPSAPKK